MTLQLLVGGGLATSPPANFTFMEGWFYTERSLIESELWLSEKFTRGQAWIDLIGLANHKKGFINIRGNIIIIQRGQCGWSEVRLGQRWKWSRKRVNNFLKWLEKEQQIIQQKSSRTSIITICNYEKYQKKNLKNDTPDVAAECTAEEQQKSSRVDTNKECKRMVMNENENITNVIVPVAQKQKRDFRNPEIEDLLSAIKLEIGIDDFADAQKWQRIHGKNCLGLLKKIGREEFRRRLTIIKNDDFKRKRCNEIRYIYEQIKGFLEPKQSIAIIS